VEETAFEVSHFHIFQTSVTLDRVVRHTVVYHSSTSTDTPNFVQVRKKILCTDVRTDRHWDRLY